jgi:hypothetical protein
VSEEINFRYSFEAKDRMEKELNDLFVKLSLTENQHNLLWDLFEEYGYLKASEAYEDGYNADHDR